MWLGVDSKEQALADFQRAAVLLPVRADQPVEQRELGPEGLARLGAIQRSIQHLSLIHI